MNESIVIDKIEKKNFFLIFWVVPGLRVYVINVKEVYLQIQYFQLEIPNKTFPVNYTNNGFKNN